jgi:hypothetical protein
VNNRFDGLAVCLFQIETHSKSDKFGAFCEERHLVGDVVRLVYHEGISVIFEGRQGFPIVNGGGVSQFGGSIEGFQFWVRRPAVAELWNASQMLADAIEKAVAFVLFLSFVRPSNVFFHR